MKLFSILAVFTILLGSLSTTLVASAATSPGLGAANSFVILSSTYTNTASGTTLNGDLGYTIPPETNPTVNGATHSANTTYNQAGIDQGAALTNLNNQACSYTFDDGDIDLASAIVNGGPVGTYTPGVYCITGAASIGGGGTVTLNGAGTYIFRMDGALTTSADSSVVLANGASTCDVWWTPTAATTLGANSTFLGTDISPAGITIGSNVDWTGRALAFGGTVSTDSDRISAGACSTTPGDGTTPPTDDATTPPAGGTTPPSTPSSSATDTQQSSPGFPDTSSAPVSSSLVALLGLIVGGIVLASGTYAMYLARKKS